MVLSQIASKIATLILLGLIVYWSLVIFLGVNAIIAKQAIEKYGSISGFFNALSQAWNNFVNTLSDAWNNFWKSILEVKK